VEGRCGAVIVYARPLRARKVGVGKGGILHDSKVIN